MVNNIDKQRIPEQILQVLNTLNINGYPSFLVGGCVRDLLLGKEPKDYDVCTKALPKTVKLLFPKVIATGIKHGTVTVLTEKLSVEVTTFRRKVNDQQSVDHLTGQMEFGTDVREDVLTRDFTINGILYDGNQVIDYVGGVTDLREGVVRGIRDAASRFREDPLRMLRAIRFACQLEFKIEAETFAAIIHNRGLITKVAAERIREELNKILLSNQPSRGFQLLQQSQLLRYILPELEACYGFEQCNPYHTQAVFDHILTVVENVPPVLHLRWAALLHDIGKPLTFTMDQQGAGHFYGHDLKSYELAKEILIRLRFDNKLIRKVTLLVYEHMNKLKNPHRSTLKRLINRVGAENVEELLELQIADVKRPGNESDEAALSEVKNQIQMVLQQQEPLSSKDLAINGDDLKALGIKPGRLMGKIISELIEMVIEKPELNTKAALIEVVKGMGVSSEEVDNDAAIDN
ncbi:MAG TPA: CCA tRNA nucleotidyltransferase [Bacillota bacterium]|nr:CCA tRNA nucleotidyltransferase [Bacillota bacterium]HOL08664.1 CCA tRNA nucleotidyltransferase [Bacillota bacterium]HPO96634.1 CCA tRNA nucleotidyltransferase [Bacillota bacterium]